MTHFPPQPGVPGRLGWPAIQDIKQDSTGALWWQRSVAGSIAATLRPGSSPRFGTMPPIPASLVHDNVRTLSFDENGMLWIATVAGWIA